MSKILFRIAIFSCITLLMVNLGFAKIHQQKDSLFQVDVPAGWNWSELADGQITITSEDADCGISIQFVPLMSATPMTEEEKRYTVKLTAKTVFQILSPKRAASVIDEKEIELGGVYAYQTDFRYGDNDLSRRAFVIVFIEKGYTFQIMCVAKEEKSEKVAEAQNIAYSFSFSD